MQPNRFDPVQREMSRRRFMWCLSMSAAGWLAGCATNPVTGEQQLMLVSKEQEIQIDRQYSPLQFSNDYGPVQDQALNDYVNRVGLGLTAHVHRPDMPYAFKVVNATYVNAYAFPGGSIACTRGILLGLDNEAELAALLGHELGHVNARHTAEQMSKGMLTQAVVGGISVLAGAQGAIYGQLASQLGSIGAGALLASYSRDNERQADALGMQYMVQSGYGPQGMVGLMDLLRRQHREKPSSIELMFATHPMSDERYQTAVETARDRFRDAANLPLHRERFMDQTARLRAEKKAIETLQAGEKQLYQKQFVAAEEQFRLALQAAPDDYAGLVLMAKCQLLQKKTAEGLRYAQRARQVYPQEAQAHHLSGFARLQQKEYADSFQDFNTYQRLMPLDPNTAFFKGYCQEGMQNRPAAAQEYHRYLQTIRQGQYAQHAYRRMVEWGYYTQ